MTESRIPLRPLGQTRLCVPVITFGSMQLGGSVQSDRERENTIRAAIDSGITAIDTAPLYGFGHCEEVVGRAIHGCRDKVQVLTKVGLRWDDQHGQILFGNVRRNSRPESVRLEVDRSLRRLNVDRLDLVQVHHRDHDTPIADTMGVLGELREEGKLGEIGVSNYSSEELIEADSTLGHIPLASIQSPYSLIRRDVEEVVLPTAQKASIGFLCYSPLEQSLLAGRLLAAKLTPTSRRRNHWPFLPRNSRPINKALRDTVLPIARGHRATLAQVALAWLLAQPGVTSVIVGASSIKQVADNAGAAGLELKESEVQAIRDAFETIELDRHARPHIAYRLVKHLRSRLGHIRRRLL